MNILFKKYWIIIFSLPIFLASCQKQPKKEPQTLRLNFQEGDVPTLHPHLLEGHMRGRVLGKALFEGLTRINPLGEAELAGAETVEISTCQTQYTFTLRDHKWSDGTSVTAFQYEKSWKEAISPTSDCGRADLFYVIEGAEKAKKRELPLEEVGVKASDDKTLVVQLDFPAPYFLKLIASPLFAPVERTKGEPKRFNGPFKVEKWIKSDLLILTANPYFWDYGRLSLKKIEIQMVSDFSTALFMYEKQKIDWMGNPLCKFSSEMVLKLQEKGELYQRSVARALWIYLNTESAPLDSPKIRQAFSLAIDRIAITDHIYPCNTPLYTPLPFSLSLCPHTLSDCAVDKAKLLFDEGLRDLNFSKETFPTVTISYPNVAGYKQLAEYLQEIWEKTFGIKVLISGAEWNIFRSNIEKGAFQTAMCGAASLYPDPAELLERFGPTSTSNFSRWENPTYQEKLHLAKKIPQKRMELLSEAEEILLEEMPLIPICSFSSLFVHHPKLKGYVLDHNGCVDFRWAYFEK